MKVTISDVAKLAGVSTATVSHTINSTRYVSGETKEKVYKAIAELGYTPDASARSFRTGNFFFISISLISCVTVTYQLSVLLRLFHMDCRHRIYHTYHIGHTYRIYHIFRICHNNHSG